MPAARLRAPWNRLAAKFALLLAAAFVVIGGLLVYVTQEMFEPGRLLQLTVEVAIAGVAFAMLAALAVLLLLTRRLKRLSAAVEAFQRQGFAKPLELPFADPDGDEIDRLAAHFEMMSERIAHQIRELEQLALRRRELLANVSHDLRTPLASMQGYLEMMLLRGGDLDAAEARNYLETAARHSERLGRLVGDLFQLTKLEAEEVTPHPEPFALAELAQDVAQKFALDAARRDVRLAANCVHAVPATVVEADIGMIERVLENLVDNALRHTPPGGVVTLALDLDAGRAQMAVQDTGQGIAPEDLASIFDRYYRAQRVAGGEARAASEGHAGLGLAIARRIVRLHGGELVVRSTLGQGTSFAFDLPLARPAAERRITA